MAARVDRTVIVTRALGALGQVRAQGFSAGGGHVGLAARPRHEEAGRALVDDIGNGALLVSSDVADEASWAEVVAMVEDLSGSMAVLVKSLAVGALGGVEQVRIEDWRPVIESNLTGSLLGVRAVALSMRKRGGSIILVSSIVGLHPTSGFGPARPASRPSAT